MQWIIWLITLELCRLRCWKKSTMLLILEQLWYDTNLNLDEMLKLLEQIATKIMKFGQIVINLETLCILVLVWIFFHTKINGYSVIVSNSINL